MRSSSDSCVLVAVSLSAAEVTTKLTDHDVPDVCPLDRMVALPEWSVDGSLREGITLGPGQVGVWEVR